MAAHLLRAAFWICYILAFLLSAHTASGAGVSINGHTMNSALSMGTGMDFSLRCSAEGNTADEELIWYREDGLLDLNAYNKINHSEVCVVNISSSDNEVPFTCMLKSNSTAKVTVVLDVQFPPELSGEDILKVEEGSDVTITCNVKANPQPDMTWRQVNGSLVFKKNRFSQSRTSEIFRLSISKAEKSDSGTYTCEALVGGMVTTRDFHLVVEDKGPVFPLEAIIAAAVVGLLTIAFGIFARRKKIFKCFNKQVSTAM
ncbi:transmembrane and immunoglobulin domain-containing protein 1 [Ambystoma mexicanum]|uniref:transmembrane and immunoglobulin domain-containing protein 1 n=1 Tax=Ambystoma mexicanum TaxID=8296 RepID=UPI0037E78388